MPHGGSGAIQSKYNGQGKCLMQTSSTLESFLQLQPAGQHRASEFKTKETTVSAESPGSPKSTQDPQQDHSKWSLLKTELCNAHCAWVDQ